MTEFDFERYNLDACRSSGEGFAERVAAQIAAGDSPLGSIHRHMQIIVRENDHYFSTIGSSFLSALADKDIGLDIITDYLEDSEERWIVDEDRPPVRLALAAAYLRNGELERAQTTFFEASALARRGFRPQDLPRINDFVHAWTMHTLGGVGTEQ